MNTPSRPTAAPIDPARRYVRVRGERRGLVEFDFAIGEPELFVELMLAPEAFAEFCRMQRVVLLDAPEPITESPTGPPASADAQNWRLSDVAPSQPN